MWWAKLIAVITLTVITLPAPMVGQETNAGWAQASAGRVLEFPADHASHPDYRIEWWYYTGNLEGVDGQRFGYQVTFFRVGIDRVPENPSVWSVRDLFIAHLAVTDLARGLHFVSGSIAPVWRGPVPKRTDCKFGTKTGVSTPTSPATSCER